MRAPSVSPTNSESGIKAVHSHKGAMAAKKKMKKATGRPKRPLSAYNIFFQVARAAIRAGDRNLSSLEALNRLDLFNLVIDRNDSKEQNKGKKGQESSVKMGFKGLATTIARKWNSIQPALKTLFVERANIEKIKFNRELEHWKHLQVMEKGNGSLFASYQQQTSLLSLQLANSPMYSMYPPLGTAFDQEQYKGRGYVQQRMMYQTSSLSQNEGALEPTMKVLPLTPNMQYVCPPGNSVLYSFQGFQGPQDVSQSHSSARSSRCASNGEPQVMPPECQPYGLIQPVILCQMLSSNPRTHMSTGKQHTMLGATAAPYPQGNDQVPPTLQQACFPSFDGRHNNGRIKVSGQGTGMPSQDSVARARSKEGIPVQQLQAYSRKCESRRIVSPYDDDLRTQSQLITHVVGADIEEHYVLKSAIHFDLQDELGWDDTSLFMDHLETMQWSGDDRVAHSRSELTEDCIL